MAEKTHIMVKRFKIVPIKDNKSDNDAYSFIRNSIYAQYRALNIGMGHTVSNYYKFDRDFNNENYKESIRNFKYNMSNPMFSHIEFGRGTDTLSLVSQKVKKDFSTALKNGLANGDRSATNYKRNFPLMTRGRDIKIYNNENNEVFIKWVNGINFKIILGRKSGTNYHELQSILKKVTEGDYKLGQSQIFFKKAEKQKKGKEKNKESKEGLYIDLSLDISEEINKKIANKKINNFDEKVMGIDLGLSIPAYAAINDIKRLFPNKSFGNKFELLKTKTQFKERQKRVYKQLELAKGGKGRKDKLSALETLSNKERNWTKTYNHQMSKKIIDFANKNNVTQINLEKLTKEGISDRVLGKWCYYELQQMIKYKAEREGIVVKFINPAYTSQMCSRCGHTEEDNRKKQEEFICLMCGYKSNADRNAALNIAKSIEYVE